MERKSAKRRYGEPMQHLHLISAMLGHRRWRCQQTLGEIFVEVDPVKCWARKCRRLSNFIFCANLRTIKEEFHAL